MLAASGWLAAVRRHLALYCNTTRDWGLRNAGDGEPAMTVAVATKQVCIVGLGYIGLPTAAVLARAGYRVHGVDAKHSVVTTVNGGGIQIVEPGLAELVREAVEAGRLTASRDPVEADVFILAVPTPLRNGNSPDLQHVEAAARATAHYLRPGSLLILESTSPVGTTQRVAEWALAERPDLAPGDFFVAHCPERTLPGRIVEELLGNDRVVGGIDEPSTLAAADFYRSFVTGQVMTTDSRTAELVKLAENTYRDVNIALANELSLICDDLGIDVWKLIELANHHPRVNLLRPGPGVGGHCLAVDPWFIVGSAPAKARLIRTAREVNDAKPAVVVERVRQLAFEFESPVIACFGLTYKADVDDLRGSPALEVTRRLAEARIGEILAVDPYVRQLPATLSDCGVRLAEQQQALLQANILVGLVEHHPFKRLEVSHSSRRAVLDTRGMWR